jgi:hypothetical protein
VLNLDDDLIRYGAPLPAEFGKDDVMVLQIRHVGTRHYYVYQSPHELILPVSSGGTGNDDGVATSPSYTLVTPTAYGSPATNINADFGFGTQFRFNATTNVHLAASSGRAASGKAKDSFWRMSNINTVSETYVTLSFNPAWNTIGFGSPHAITNGGHASFRVVSEGPNESDVWAYNTLGGVAEFTGGGGEEPPSTLSDGLIAHISMDDGANTFADNKTSAGSIYDFTPVDASRFGVGYTGQIGTAWTNGVAGSFSALVNTHADIKPPSDGARTYAFWMKRYTGFSFAQAQSTTSDASWYLWRNNSKFQLTYSTSGTTSAGSIISDTTYDNETWYFVVIIVDKGSGVLKLSINGADVKSVNVTPYASTAGISYGALSGLGLAGGSLLDDLIVWNRALSNAEIEEAYSVTDWSEYY